MTGLNIKGGVQHDLILQVCLGVASTKRELLEGNRLALHPICGGGGGGGWRTDTVLLDASCYRN